MSVSVCRPTLKDLFKVVDRSTKVYNTETVTHLLYCLNFS